MYTAGKAKYLQECGWKVFVFFAGVDEGVSAIPSLTQYVATGGGMNFFCKPPYKFKTYEQENFLNFMLQRLGLVPTEEYDIIIESHYHLVAYWAELLAAKIGARHFFICTDEGYRPTPTSPNVTYGDNLDFFYFKWKRNELISRKKVAEKLFNGYKNINATLIDIPETCREQDAIQDVTFKIENIERLDWNICHIGRIGKDYVSFVIKGVGELARRYPEKKINFIMVGKADEAIPFMREIFSNLPNVLVTLLGDMVPIPRILFSKIDVVCAISQSAIFAANEDVPTIVACAGNPARTPGLFGYDTEDSVFGEGTFSYAEALENVLLKKIYAGQKYRLPKLKPAEEYYDAFWTIVEQASPVKEYFTEKLSRERIRNWKAIFPFDSVSRNARIIFFGENDITSDYREQIINPAICSKELAENSSNAAIYRPYCEVIATVDEHHEDFDNSVVDFDRLRVRDYDSILICLPPQRVQAAYEKIAQIVPDMVSKIIWDLRIQKCRS